MTSQKNISLQNKLEFVASRNGLLFLKGFNKLLKNCDTVAVLDMLKQNFSLLASYVIVNWVLQTVYRRIHSKRTSNNEWNGKFSLMSEYCKTT